MKQPTKQYLAQVFMMDRNGHKFEFISTLDSHKKKIENIRKDRVIIEEKVRFIEKLPQQVWSYKDIPSLGKE